MKSRGFSLLEVMVAVSILGLALTVILSAQAGLAASSKSASNMGQAVTIARCRMTELEEKLLKLGYQEIDEVDSSGICCDEKDVTGFSCDWRVEKVVLPNPPSMSMDGGMLSLSGGLDGGAGALPGALASAIPGTTGGATLNLDAGLQGIGSAVTQQFGAMGGAQGMLGMVFGMVYPAFKPMMEMSIRRITVTIKYKEGSKDREFTLVQYVTNPQRANLLAGFDGGAPIPGATGTAGTPGAPGAPGSPATNTQVQNPFGGKP